MDLVLVVVSPWITIDGLHRRILDELLEQFGVPGLSEADKDN